VYTPPRREGQLGGGIEQERCAGAVRKRELVNRAGRHIRIDEAPAFCACLKPFGLHFARGLRVRAPQPCLPTALAG